MAFRQLGSGASLAGDLRARIAPPPRAGVAMARSPPLSHRLDQRPTDARSLSPVEADPWPVAVLVSAWAMGARRFLPDRSPCILLGGEVRRPYAADYAERQPGGRVASTRHGQGWDSHPTAVPQSPTAAA